MSFDVIDDACLEYSRDNKILRQPHLISYYVQQGILRDIDNIKRNINDDETPLKKFKFGSKIFSRLNWILGVSFEIVEYSTHKKEIEEN